MNNHIESLRTNETRRSQFIDRFLGVIGLIAFGAVLALCALNGMAGV